MKFVAVVSCPTGIAHTYMAAEALETAGKELGHEVVVETQGAALPAGDPRYLRRFHADLAPLDPALIAAADGIIYAAGREVVGKDRFAGKPFVDVGVNRAVREPRSVMEEAVAAVEASPPPSPSEEQPAAAKPKKTGLGARIRNYLTTDHS